MFLGGAFDEPITVADFNILESVDGSAGPLDFQAVHELNCSKAD